MPRDLDESVEVQEKEREGMHPDTSFADGGNETSWLAQMSSLRLRLYGVCNKTDTQHTVHYPEAPGQLTDREGFGLALVMGEVCLVSHLSDSWGHWLAEAKSPAKLAD